MTLDDDQRRLILGALDTLGTQLSEHGHQWTEGEREIYDQSVAILTPTEPQTWQHTIPVTDPPP